MKTVMTKEVTPDGVTTMKNTCSYRGINFMPYAPPNPVVFMGLDFLECMAKQRGLTMDALLRESPDNWITILEDGTHIQVNKCSYK